MFLFQENQLSGNNTVLVAYVKVYFNSHCKVKDLSTLKYFLGMELARSNSGIYLNQRNYILDLIKDVGLNNCTTSVVPMEQNHQLLTADDSKIISDISLYIKDSWSLNLFNNLTSRYLILSSCSITICG